MADRGGADQVHSAAIDRVRDGYAALVARLGAGGGSLAADRGMPWARGSGPSAPGRRRASSPPRTRRLLHTDPAAQGASAVAHPRGRGGGGAHPGHHPLDRGQPGDRRLSLIDQGPQSNFRLHGRPHESPSRTGRSRGQRLRRHRAGVSGRRRASASRRLRLQHPADHRPRHRQAASSSSCRTSRDATRGPRRGGERADRGRPMPIRGCRGVLHLLAHLALALPRRRIGTRPGARHPHRRHLPRAADGTRGVLRESDFNLFGRTCR
jgi:hypothetical protein